MVRTCSKCRFYSSYVRHVLSSVGTSATRFPIKDVHHSSTYVLQIILSRCRHLARLIHQFLPRLIRDYRGLDTVLLLASASEYSWNLAHSASLTDDKVADLTMDL